MRISFDIDLEKGRSGIPGMMQKVRALVDALVVCDRIFLRANPETRPLYQSGCVYIPEKKEEFLEIPYIIKQGGADCEDLAAWRVAELQEKGIKAKPWIRMRAYTLEKQSDFHLFHILVKWPDGSVEDPSKILGMRGEF